MARARQQSPQRQQRQRSAPAKRVNLADYPDDIKQYLRASLSTMSRMEVSE